MDDLALAAACCDWSEAERLGRARVEERERDGSPHAVISARAALAQVLLDAGRATEAARVLAEARRGLSAAPDNPVVSAELDLAEGRIAALKEDWESATSLLNRAAASLDECPRQELRLATVLRTMAEVTFTVGDVESGVSLLNAVWKIGSASTDGLVLEMQALAGLAEAARAVGDSKRRDELVDLARKRVSQEDCPIRFRTYAMQLLEGIAAE